MWPDTFEAWTRAYPLYVLFTQTRSSLNYYRILRGNMGLLAEYIFRSCERIYDRAREYRSYPTFFDSETAFRQWLREAAEREARRGVLRPPAVQACLSQLPPTDQQLLYWYYAEAFSVSSLARALWGSHPARETDAREAVLTAQARFLNVLRQSGWSEGNWTFPL